MQIVYSKDALKYLDKQEKKSVGKIREAISKLIKTPPEGDIAPMKGYMDGRMRLRISGWRVIYKYSTIERIEILYVLDIGNRGDIYK